MNPRERDRLLREAVKLRKPADPLGTEPLFDAAPLLGGRAVDETDTPKARRTSAPPDATECPRCGQLVRPGPHTRPDSTICERHA